MTTDLRWVGGGTWSQDGAGFSSFDLTSSQSYADGKSVIFDISGTSSSPVTVSGTLCPRSIYLMNPVGHDYTFIIEGALAGEMNLYKSMEGTATFNGNLGYTGTTEISEGVLRVNGSIAGPVNLRAKGSLLPADSRLRALSITKGAD